MGRAIRTHICRLNLMELIPEKSGDRRANLLVQETHVLQKLIDEEEHAGPLRCSAMRMLLAMAAKEIVKDTSSTSRPKVLSMLGSHVKRMQMGVQFGAMTSGPGHWVDPKEDWVVEHTQKLAFKVEKFEGATSKQRLEHRLQVMISTFQYAQQCAADASIRSLKDSCFVQVSGQARGIWGGGEGACLGCGSPKLKLWLSSCCGGVPARPWMAKTDVSPVTDAHTHISPSQRLVNGLS